MRPRHPNAARAIILALAFAPAAAAQNGPQPPLQRIDRDRLCVTNGAVTALPGGRLAIDTPSSRGFLQGSTASTADQVAEIRFRYLGPSQDSKPLASGELRRQIGLKLRAQDTCNLVYAMWRIEPEAIVAVSVKRNAALHTHEQCGARGYINFKPQDRTPLPLRPGETHTLKAELHGQELTVTADGNVAWQGSLGSAASLPVGPVGFRTDNARFVLEYFADAPGGPRRAPQPGAPGQTRCVISEGD
jgi:hypothetical protein